MDEYFDSDSFTSSDDEEFKPKQSHKRVLYIYLVVKTIGYYKNPDGLTRNEIKKHIIDNYKIYLREDFELEFNKVITFGINNKILKHTSYDKERIKLYYQNSKRKDYNRQIKEMKSLTGLTSRQACVALE